MTLTNLESIPGQSIVEHYGLVQGSTIRAKHVVRDFMAGLKNIVGGELKGYTELMREARQQATIAGSQGIREWESPIGRTVNGQAPGRVGRIISPGRH